MSTEEFIFWLQNEMDKRGWSQADLVRKSKLTSAGISRLITGQRGIGIDSAKAIAKALRLPPEVVYEKAGILPKRRINQNDEIIIHKYRLLNLEAQRQVSDYIDFLLSRAEETKKRNIQTEQELSETEIVGSIRQSALRYGYDLEETQILSMLKGGRKEKEFESDRIEP